MRNRAEDRDRAQDVDERTSDGPENGGPADIAFRVADPAGGDRSRLDAEIAEEGNRRSCADRADRRTAAGVERAEIAGLHEEQADGGDEQQRDELDDRGQDLEPSDA